MPDRADEAKGKWDLCCPVCGYDRAGTPGRRCPECGTEETPGVVRKWPSEASSLRVSFWLAAAFLLLAYVGLVKEAYKYGVDENIAYVVFTFVVAGFVCAAFLAERRRAKLSRLSPVVYVLLTGVALVGVAVGALAVLAVYAGL